LHNPFFRENEMAGVHRSKIHGRFNDLAGKRFGLLTVERHVETIRQERGRPRQLWLCRCECGETVEVYGRRLTQRTMRRPVRSCGHEAWGGLDLSLTTAAYLAGLVDGEGCLCLCKDLLPRTRAGFRYRACLSIGMTTPILPVLAGEVGIGNVTTRQAGGGRKPCFIWYNGAADCRKLLPALLPHLRVKHEQAGLLISYLKLAQRAEMMLQQSRGAYLGGVETIYLRLRVLNRKGVLS
jgi:hypothetical protein